SDEIPCAKKDLQKGSHPHKKNRPYAHAAIAGAEIARVRSIARLPTQYISPNRSFKPVDPG
ncbi:hypothetical protein, partial [Planktotalea frisia]|uniref:hypothetical protein n=1 Tax=Planktotalea frisia TaxID=696762 RepID=UPI001C31AD3B